MWDGVDRRRFIRAEYPCLIKLRKDTPPEQAILTHTEDISLGGVSVIVRQKIELMTEISLELDLMDTSPTIALKGTVNRVEEIPFAQEGKPPRYAIGIRFIDLPDEERHRIQRIIDHLWNKRKEK